MQKKIEPGVALGKLLAKGEEISINENITDKETIIAKLQKTDLWPKISK